ncbi:MULTISPECIES: helix-turn-helix domain-containing protein [Burkholderia]|uniref:AraC family transcriptional regulator n=1 Tax=Burkholderia paludis TaxID=1506587 RepID=A0A6P2J1Q3_9BURK|nr:MULTISPECIES: helix-turn-helix domain-containing protein [Burkholderia]CAB3755610.1 hypothetical protein LMG30113_02513 [Burkholderia paludis]VWB37214.1 AraC family transcriptional regulator [Burkholderia paludis]
MPRTATFDMRVDHRLPAAPLRALIDRYWSWDGAGMPSPALLPVMPGPGGMEIFFHFHAPFERRSVDGACVQALPHAHVACVRGAPIRFATPAAPGFVAVRVRAGAIPRLTGLPATELADSVVSAEDVWGPPAAELAERIALGAGAAERAALLDDFFLAQLRKPSRGSRIDDAVAGLLRGDPARIADVAAAAGLCRRQLAYRFRAATGSSPVCFRRLARLQRALRTIVLASPDRSLTDLLDAGYADQAHQTHEFRALTGFSPGEVRRAALAGHAHFYNAAWPR